MKKLITIIGIISILVILTSCTSQNSGGNQPSTNPFMNLSTDGGNDSGDSLFLNDSSQEQNNINNEENNQLIKKDNDIKVNPDENDVETSEQNENAPESNEQSNQDTVDQGAEQHSVDEITEKVPNDHKSLQQTIPEQVVPENNQQEELQPDNHMVISTVLPFENFKERWNAVSDEEMSDLFIKSLEKKSETASPYYFAKLTNHTELRIHVKNNYVQKMELLSEPNSKEDIFQMLTGWVQIVKILHPDIEVVDVDHLFHEIGVGPNGDLSKLKESKFNFKSLFYQIKRSGNNYHFTSSYHKEA